MAITVTLLVLTVSSFVANSVNAQMTGTSTVTITVNSNVNGRLEPVQDATVTISGTYLPGETLTGSTDGSGQVSFSNEDIIANLAPNVLYEVNAIYGALPSGCTFFSLGSSSTSLKLTVTLGSSVTVLLK